MANDRGQVTLSIQEGTYQRLSRVRAKLMEQRGRNVTYTETIDALIEGAAIVEASTT